VVAQNMVNKTMDFMSEDGKLHVLFLFFFDGPNNHDLWENGGVHQQS